MSGTLVRATVPKGTSVNKLALALSLALVCCLALVATGVASAAGPKPTTPSSWAACMSAHGVSVSSGARAAQAVPAAVAACGVPVKGSVAPIVSCLRTQALDLAVGSLTAGAGVDEGGRLVAALKQCSAELNKLDARLGRFKVCMAKHGVTVPTTQSGLLSLGWKLLTDRDGVVAAVKSCRTSTGSLTLPPSLQKALGGS